MGRKNKKNEPKKIAQKVQAGLQKEMTLQEQIAVVEDKILEGVKKLASGIDISLAKLVDAGQELIDLEALADAEADQEDGEGEGDNEEGGDDANDE